MVESVCVLTRSSAGYLNYAEGSWWVFEVKCDGNLCRSQSGALQWKCLKSECLAQAVPLNFTARKPKNSDFFVTLFWFVNNSQLIRSHYPVQKAPLTFQLRRCGFL